MITRMGSHLKASAATGTSAIDSADFNPIEPRSVKMWGPSHKFFDINVQNLTMSSAYLQQYAVLLLLCDLRYSILNSEAAGPIYTVSGKRTYSFP